MAKKLTFFLLVWLFFLISIEGDGQGRRKWQNIPKHLEQTLKKEHRESQDEYGHYKRRKNLMSRNMISPKQTSLQNHLDPNELFKCNPDKGCTRGLVCRNHICQPCLNDKECLEGKLCVPSPQVIKVAAAVGIGFGANSKAEVQAKVKSDGPNSNTNAYQGDLSQGALSSIQEDKKGPLQELADLLTFVEKHYPDGALRCQNKEEMEKETENPQGDKEEDMNNGAKSDKKMKDEIGGANRCKVMLVLPYVHEN